MSYICIQAWELPKWPATKVNLKEIHTYKTGPGLIVACVKLHVVAGKSQTLDSETVAQSLTTDGYVRPPYHTCRTHSTGLRSWCPFRENVRGIRKKPNFIEADRVFCRQPRYHQYTTLFQFHRYRTRLRLYALWPWECVVTFDSCCHGLGTINSRSVPVNRTRFRDEVQIVSDTSAVETSCVEHWQDIKWCVNFYFSY